VLDDIGQIAAFTCDPGTLESLREHAACRADEGATFDIPFIPGLFSDEHDIGCGCAFAKHRLGREGQARQRKAWCLRARNVLPAGAAILRVSRRRYPLMPHKPAYPSLAGQRPDPDLDDERELAGDEDEEEFDADDDEEYDADEDTDEELDE
jgi:hypothetical protein